jgi:cell division protein FtsB
MAKHGSAALSIGLGAAILYLGANAVTGHQGLLAYVDLQAREHVLEGRLAELRHEHAALEARADRLKPATLDMDYLDERARIDLSAGDSNELVFALDQPGH